jgi:hypothetical protein
MGGSRCRVSLRYGIRNNVELARDAPTLKCDPPIPLATIPDPSRLQPDGQIVYRFHARDLHLVLGPAADNKPIRFDQVIAAKR